MLSNDLGIVWCQNVNIASSALYDKPSHDKIHPAKASVQYISATCGLPHMRCLVQALRCTSWLRTVRVPGAMHALSARASQPLPATVWERALPLPVGQLVK